MTTTFKILGPYKVQVTPYGIAAFNRKWPGSKIEAGNGHWFEFDSAGNLVDHSLPEDQDGMEVCALIDDVWAWYCQRKDPKA